MKLTTCAAVLLASSFAAIADDDPLAPWRSGVKISVVSPKDGQHTMHSYFNTCPESPDGKFVLFYSSTAPDGHHGEVVIRNRASGEEGLAGKVTSTKQRGKLCEVTLTLDSAPDGFKVAGLARLWIAK